MFGDYNPYRQPLFGDWLAMPSRGEDPDKHPGMVFLNGRALYEVTSLEDTFAPRYRDHVKDYVTDVACAIDDPEMTQCVWYARSRTTVRCCTRISMAPIPMRNAWKSRCVGPVSSPDAIT